MEPQSYFLFAALSVGFYVVVGNVLYLSKVVPYLGQFPDFRGPSLLPSEQLRHIAQYARAMQISGQCGTWCIIAKNFTIITILVAVIAVAFISLAVLNS